MNGGSRDDAAAAIDLGLAGFELRLDEQHQFAAGLGTRTTSDGEHAR